MASDPETISEGEHSSGHDAVEMPRPTIAPLILALGLATLAAGVVTSSAFIIVGAAMLVVGLSWWVFQLLHGRGHVFEPFVAPAQRPAIVTGRPSAVEQLRAGMPGYRFRLPTEVRPISSGVWGGLVGGLVMPIPAMLYGVFSGHGIWYPINLLAGIVLPGLGRLSIAELEQFSPMLLILSALIHAFLSLVLGLIYGVLLPTLPPIPRPIAWGGLLMPLLWSGVSYALLRRAEVALTRGVDWPWFIISQFLFGLVAAGVVMRSRTLHPVLAGVLGGVVGGLLMPLPALLWGRLSGHGIWYPANLLAAMVLPGLGVLPTVELEQFHAHWLGAAIAFHVVMSLGFGLVYGLLLPRLRPIPGPLAWGGLLFPLLWTGTSFGLMGVVNPILQRRVDWPWFIVSQFVFGVVASIVIVRSQLVYIAPAGHGPDRAADFVAGSSGDQP